MMVVNTRIHINSKCRCALFGVTVTIIVDPYQLEHYAREACDHYHVYVRLILCTIWKFSRFLNHGKEPEER